MFAARTDIDVAQKKKKRISTSSGDRVFYLLVNAVMLVLLVLVLYPLTFVVSSSFSSPNAVLGGKVFLWPVEPGLIGYRTVFQYKSVLTGYLNSIFYTATGTGINLAMTLMCAYPLARSTLPFRSGIMFLFTFTMFFSGGTVPFYLLVRDLGLIGNVGAVILPGAISVYNMIITRTFIQNSIPAEMLEAAQIDGCGDVRYFFQMVLPLSKAIIAVITLYYAVAHWNGWFNAFLFLSDRSMYPLQLVLRDILLSNRLDTQQMDDPELAQMLLGIADMMKYSLIVVASVPMMCIYPFVQKHFVRGVMIGSVKG